MVEKIKHAVDLSVLCNKVCFKEYTHAMTSSEEACHEKCFDNFYSALLSGQKKFY